MYALQERLATNFEAQKLRKARPGHTALEHQDNLFYADYSSFSCRFIVLVWHFSCSLFLCFLSCRKTLATQRKMDPSKNDLMHAKMD